MGRKQSKVAKPKIMVDGSVYLIRLQIDDTEVYKVGVTTYSVARRVLGIIESVWKSYGYFPKAEIVNEWRVGKHYNVESNVHKELREMGYGYTSRQEFSGSTELFYGMDVDKISALIDGIVNNSDKVSEESLNRISDIL